MDWSVIPTTERRNFHPTSKLPDDLSAQVMTAVVC
ncbi:hypothetical protein VTO73DRAFT_11392 [Trametes versicolor]